MNNLLSTSQCTINIVQLIQLRLAIGVSLLQSVTVPGAIHTFQIRIGWYRNVLEFAEAVTQVVPQQFGLVI